MRALRVDKMTYAALEATLRIYDRGVADQEVPVIRGIAAGLEQIRERANQFAAALAARSYFKTYFKIGLEEGQSLIGGGSAPGVHLPTMLVTLESSDLSASMIEVRLRSAKPPVIARTERDRVVIDLRTVAPDEEPMIIHALETIAAEGAGEAASLGVQPGAWRLD